LNIEKKNKQTKTTTNSNKKLGDSGVKGENSRTKSLSSGRSRNLVHKHGWNRKCAHGYWSGESQRPNRAEQPQIQLQFCGD